MFCISPLWLEVLFLLCCRFEAKVYQYRILPEGDQLYIKVRCIRSPLFNKFLHMYYVSGLIQEFIMRK